MLSCTCEIIFCFIDELPFDRLLDKNPITFALKSETIFEHSKLDLPL